MTLSRCIVTIFGEGQIVASMRGATADPILVDEFRVHRSVFDRHLTAAEGNADPAPELIEALLRIDVIFEPTRQGCFLRALRKKIRAGTASMTNVFGEHRWRASTDFNVHARVAYLALEWLQPAARADFRRSRPEDIAAGFDVLAPDACDQLARRRAGQDACEIAVTARQAAVLPVFAAH